MFIKSDPGPCPICSVPHTACVAPGSGGAIVAGPIQTPTSITVPTPAASVVPPAERPAAVPTVTTTSAPPPDPPFTTKNYRGRDKREPPGSGQV